MMLQKRQILFIGNYSKLLCQDLISLGYTGMALYDIPTAQAWLINQVKCRKDLPAIILCDADKQGEDALAFFTLLKKLPINKQLVFALLSLKTDERLTYRAYKTGIDEVFLLPASAIALHLRLQHIIELKSMPITLPVQERLVTNHRAMLVKRVFDMVASAGALVLLLPLLLTIALLIKMESKGPVFYVSKRAGRNYKIFDFYKFRSMRVNADKELHQLARLNKYEGNSSFIKIRNDPRVTRLGAFLRSTSLDELPQLVNVLKGDMSLIGNRPLPLYEAQNLTTDEWALRFLAPAGMTGLWQVTKKGETTMIDLDRKHLDARYAVAQSLELDYKIFIKTFSAMKQYV